MRILKLLAVLTFFFTPFSAYAAVDSVTPSPARVSIAQKGSTTLSVTWTVAETAPTTGVIITSSPNAFLQVNGATIATLAGTLTQSVSRTLAETSTSTFRETLSISPALARRIAQAGAGSVTIIRAFSDGTGPTTGTLQVSTGNAGDLSVRRIELQFENQSRTDIVQKGDTLRAVADVSFRSNGLLRGEWRLVNPSASLGEARGRVLQVVRQQLVSSGEGRTRIVSPPLPTDTNGLYLLSFSVEDTDGNITIPILRYFVLEGRDNVPPTNMSVLTPSDGASIDQDTVFSWAAVPEVDAYQLEILPQGSDVPVTAKLVPGTDLKLSLSALSFEDLVSGEIYDWRVRAFANGNVVGQSGRYGLHIP